jgi:N-acetylmuramoyl-L-alanine amidase
MRQRAALTARRFFLIMILVAVAFMLLVAQRTTQSGTGPGWLQPFFTNSAEPVAEVRVGIIAGHRGNDSGTVCKDGLTETEVNQKVAEMVAASLRTENMRVEVLDEFDPKLNGYEADAFVSIHADSCSVDMTGFKVASAENGSDASKQLAECLWTRYETETGLSRHMSTITTNMTQYHAFRKIAETTPAAIIETGFLGGDRAYLTQHTDRVAAGIVKGVECFLLPDKPAPTANPTPRTVK